MEICAYHNLPSPLDDEKFPVGTGSNPVSGLFILFVDHWYLLLRHYVKNLDA